MPSEFKQYSEISTDSRNFSESRHFLLTSVNRRSCLSSVSEHGVSDGTYNWGAAAVRITGVRRNRFVEFDFFLEETDSSETDLSVEMILPLPHFRQFCAERKATMLPSTEEAALAYLELCELHPDADEQEATTEKGRCRG